MTTTIPLSSTETLRRGACPSIAAPMQTGDGLLVRLRPVAPALSAGDLLALADLARAHGNGLIENLPADPGDAAVAAAVERLFADHPQAAVRAYLHLFAEMDIANWPSLRKILNTDPRLCPAPTPQPA